MPESHNESPHADHLLSLRDVLGLLERRRWTVLFALLASLLLALTWLSTARPLYRAQATLLLEDPGATSGFLGQLAALGSAPAAEGEMAVLRSREIARRTATAPPGRGRFSEEALAHPTMLALTTQVDDARFAPLPAALGRHEEAFGTRLQAWIERRAPDAPPAVALRFQADGSVELSSAGTLPGGPDPIHVASPRGALLDFHGLEFRVHWSGDPTGSSYVVRALPLEGAVERLLANTLVTESERNSGVIQIHYDDADPRRAAEVVNALCENYREYSVARARRGATRAIEFIDTQLEAQLEALEDAERALVELQSQHPESIAVDATAGALVDQMTALETRRVASELLVASLDDALTLLEDGRHEGLSQLQVQLDDPVTAGYLEAITTLTAEAESQSRSDAGPFKLLQQTQLQELRTLQDQLERSAAQLDEVVEGLAAGDESALAQLEASPSGADPITAGYLSELGRVRAELALLLVTLTDANPEVKDRRETVAALHELLAAQATSLARTARSEVEDNAALIETVEDGLARYADEERGRLGEAVERLLARTTDHLTSRRRGLGGRIADLDAQVATLRDRLASLPEAQRDQADTLRRLRTHEAVAELLLRSRQEAGITEASTVPAAAVLDRALPPRDLYFPRPLPTLLFAGLLGLAAGSVLAFVRDRLAGHVSSEAELETVTGLPVLGSIPNFRRGPARVRGAGSRFVALVDDPDGITADAYRSLRASLRFATRGEDTVRVLGVTSAIASEGKTSTNLNIALACAAAGERVLLVDCDLRRPSVHRYLDFEQSPGLGESLATEGGPSWRESVRAVPGFGLDVLPAGRSASSSSDLLADSPRLDAFLKEVSGQYDLVILDLPPVLATSDALAVAGRLDAVVLLYRSEGAPAGALRLATGKLRRSGAKVVGAVLCALRPTRYGDAGYSSYYGYGYGEVSSGRKGDRKAARRETSRAA